MGIKAEKLKEMLETAGVKAITIKVPEGSPQAKKLEKLAKRDKVTMRDLQEANVADELMQAVADTYPERERMVLTIPLRYRAVRKRINAAIDGIVKIESLHAMEKASNEAVEAAELLHKLFDQIDSGMGIIEEACPWLKEG